MAESRCLSLRSLCFAVPVIFLSQFGCSSGDPLNRQPVSGFVTLGGEPLTAGAIEFVSDNFISGAPIQNGEFKINKTFGLPPGGYTVRVTAPDLKSLRVAPDDSPGDTKLPRDLIPEAFNKKSTLTQTVEAGKPNQFQLEIPLAKK